MMYFKSFIVFVFAVLVVTAGTSFAQENAAATDGEATANDPVSAEQDSAVSDDAPADATPPSAESTAAKQAFDAIFAEWKELLSKMRMIQAKAEGSEDSELPAMQEEYDKLIAQGEAMIPKLRDTAIAVYAAAPNEDIQIARWLSTIANDYVTQDRFAEAKPALDALAAGESTDPTVYSNAGIVAFHSNEFERAQSLLEKAAAAGALTDVSRAMAYEVENYKKYWEREKQLREAEAKAEGQDRLPRVKIVTNRGELVAELFENEAPETVGNFISLVEKGFYDGRVFHRVLGNFMAQTGCPKGNGMGGPGYNIYCECVNPDHRKHFAGTLSMAHKGRDTGGSQFFITFLPTAHLNGDHTVFGRIIEGFDVLPKITRRDPNDSADFAKTPDKIERIEVLFKRDHDYKPNKT